MKKSSLIIIVSLLVLLFITVWYIGSLLSIYSSDTNFRKIGLFEKISYLKSDLKYVSEVREAQEYLNELLLTPPTKPIRSGLADTFHYNYLQHKTAMRSVLNPTAKDTLGRDSIQAVVFEFDSIILGAIRAYHLDTNHLTVADFKEKAFVIYIGNYGKMPPNNDQTKAYRNSLILQFAKKNNLSNKWKIIGNELHNFGDMKPPNTFEDEQVDGILGN